MPVAVYIRVSTNRQATEGQSHEYQERQCRAASGIYYPNESVRVYSDTSTGRSDRRSSYQAMMSEVRRRRFKSVIAYDLDRLSRNTGDFASFVRQIEENKTDLIIVKLGIISLTPVGKLILHLLMATAEFESSHIGERVKDAHKHTFLKGRKGPGCRPFGWNTDDEGKLIQNSAEQGIIDMCVSERQSSRSWSQISIAVNALGSKSVSGKSWTPQKLRGCIINALDRRRRIAEASLNKD